MRWLLVLSLTACATSLSDRDPKEERAELLRQLRESGGDANLVADGRHYMITPDALQTEIRAFTTALADAMETDRRTFRDESRNATGAEPVIAEPWLERGLRVSDLFIEAFGTGGGTCYWVWVEPERWTGYTTEEVHGTPAVDAAWTRLTDAARAAAVFTDTFGPISDFARPGSRSIRSIGGPPPVPPDEPPAAAPP